MRSDRRTFLKTTGRAALGAAACFGSTALDRALAAEERAASPRLAGKAEHCIQLWLGGGASQIDTWDPKRLGEPKKRVAGSHYPSVPTAIPDERVCEHLKRSAKVLDRAVLLRTVHHDLDSEHGAATNRMHTGRPTSGTAVYPSLGSVVAHELGAAESGVPPYVVMGYPNLTRGPGFLGPEHGFLYLTDTKTGPAALTRHRSITNAREMRRQELLAELKSSYSQRHQGDATVSGYASLSDTAVRLTGPQFMSAFDLNSEAASLREAYGSEFGQRCLLGRRLIQRGVRFLEIAHNLNFINGTGWDTHNEGQLQQHGLIQELDKAFSTLILDLEQHGLLEKTIILISTEFGRPAKFDSRGGRGHQSKAFSVVLAGGGLRTGQVVGETDELSKEIVKDPVSVPDLFATVYAALGIDYKKVLYAGERPVPITDRGQPVARLFG